MSGPYIGPSFSVEPNRSASSGLNGGRANVLGDELHRTVRTMFVLYTLLIVGGIVFFVAVGLTQQ